MSSPSLAQNSGPALTITESDYQKFCEHFYRQTGISFGENKRYFVDKRLINRMRQTKTTTFDAYVAKLRGPGGSAEIEHLINHFTINETYFYREDNQLQCLVRGILPELVANRRRGERIRIWSMPCSTGEEPYSIAMYLLENWSQVDNFEIEIMGSDIDTEVLRTAEAGIYDTRSLHRLSQDLVRRYFVSVGRDGFRLIDDLRGAVRFTQVNASDKQAMRSYVPPGCHLLPQYADLLRRCVAAEDCRVVLRQPQSRRLHLSRAL